MPCGRAGERGVVCAAGASALRRARPQGSAYTPPLGASQSRPRPDTTLATSRPTQQAPCCRFSCTSCPTRPPRPPSGAFFRPLPPPAYSASLAVEHHSGSRQLVSPDKVLREGPGWVPIPGRRALRGEWTSDCTRPSFRACRTGANARLVGSARGATPWPRQARDSLAAPHPCSCRFSGQRTSGEWLFVVQSPFKGAPARP